MVDFTAGVLVLEVVLSLIPIFFLILRSSRQVGFFTQAKIRRLSEERDQLRKQIRFDCMTRQNKRKAIFRAIYVEVSFISVFGFFILSTLLH